MKLLNVLVAFVHAGSPGFADEKSATDAAKVAVTGASAGVVYTSTTTGGKTKKMEVRILRLDDKTTMAVAMPAESKPATERREGEADSDLKKLLESAAAGQNKLITVEGRLSRTEDRLVIASAGGGESKSIPLLLAEKVVEHPAGKEPADPPRGSARIEGILVEAAPTKDGKSAEWSIRNLSGGDICLQSAADLAPPAAGTKCVATGPVRLIDGRFALAVKTIVPAK